MNVPKQKGEARRAAILAAVTPLVAEYGLDGVTTRQLAAAAGISEALLYKHFPSKQDLYEAIQAGCIAHATEDAARFEHLPDSTECLVMIVWLMMNKICSGTQREIDTLGENRPLIRLVMRSLLDDGDFAETFMNGAAAGWVRKVRACAEAAYATGDLHESPTHSSIGVWFGHHLSMSMVMTTLPNRDTVDYGLATPDGEGGPTPDQLTEHSVRFVLRGIGLTDAAIARYYRPESFEFLLEAGRDGVDPAPRQTS